MLVPRGRLHRRVRLVARRLLRRVVPHRVRVRLSLLVVAAAVVVIVVVPLLIRPIRPRVHVDDGEPAGRRRRGVLLTAVAPHVDHARLDYRHLRVELVVSPAVGAHAPVPGAGAGLLLQRHLHQLLVPRRAPVRVPRRAPIRVPRRAPVRVPRQAPVGVPQAVAQRFPIPRERRRVPVAEPRRRVPVPRGRRPALVEWLGPRRELGRELVGPVVRVAELGRLVVPAVVSRLGRDGRDAGAAAVVRVLVRRHAVALQLIHRVPVQTYIVIFGCRKCFLNEVKWFCNMVLQWCLFN